MSVTASVTLTTPNVLVVKITSSPLMLSVSPAVACPLITEPLATLGIASAIFRNIATPVSVVVKSPEPSTGYTKSPRTWIAAFEIDYSIHWS